MCLTFPRRPRSSARVFSLAATRARSARAQSLGILASLVEPPSPPPPPPPCPRPRDLLVLVHVALEVFFGRRVPNALRCRAGAGRKLRRWRPRGRHGGGERAAELVVREAVMHVLAHACQPHDYEPEGGRHRVRPGAFAGPGNSACAQHAARSRAGTGAAQSRGRDRAPLRATIEACEVRVQQAQARALEDQEAQARARSRRWSKALEQGAGARRWSKALEQGAGPGAGPGAGAGAGPRHHRRFHGHPCTGRLTEVRDRAIYDPNSLIWAPVAARPRLRGARLRSRRREAWRRCCLR